MCIRNAPPSIKKKEMRTTKKNKINEVHTEKSAKTQAKMKLIAVKCSKYSSRKTMHGGKKELFTWSANRVRIGKELGQIKTVTS